jgi:ABC-type Fe3+-siderophore transport system permease subunit
MDRVHSNLIIILLAGILLALSGILFVLLVGREEAISAIGGASGAGAFAVTLVVGTLALLFIGYVLRRRRQGHPWLFHLILWPAYVGVLVVLGLAALHSFEKACGRPQECVGQVPLYWLPVPLVLLGALVWWVEDFIIRRRKSRPPAASAGPRCGSSEH